MPAGSASAVLFSPVQRRLAHSSLGFHAAFKGLAPCERATLPEVDAPAAPRSIETGRGLGEFDCVFASVAWEPEVMRLAAALRLSGITPLRSRRKGTEPLVIGGGPVTLSNPHLLAAVCDAVFVGEADGAFLAIREAVFGACGRDDACGRLAAIRGMLVPAVHGNGADAPVPVAAPDELLPARSMIPDEPNEFGDAFVVEVGRGCGRACAFCVARAGGRRARFVPADRVLAAVPAGTSRVGLLGAAVSDHPALQRIVSDLVAGGVAITLGSVRADRVTPELVRCLVSGGLRTLTVAADGTSETVRRRLNKGVSEDDLERCAVLAREHGVGRLKLYVMVGLPGETDADIQEFGVLVRRLSRRIRVSVSASPFVPKPGTPLAAAPFLGTRELKRRMARLRSAIGSFAVLRATSPRDAELEWRLSHARGEEAETLVMAVGS